MSLQKQGCRCLHHNLERGANAVGSRLQSHSDYTVGTMVHVASLNEDVETIH